MGVPAENIFFSSQQGNIENGEFFVQQILSKLAGADLVVCMISREYLRSQFCLAEVGAAMVKKVGVPCKSVRVSDPITDKILAQLPSYELSGPPEPRVADCEPRRAQIFSCIVPPTAFSEVGGALHGIQSGVLTKRQTMVELREIVKGGKGNRHIDEVRWSSRLDSFIDFAEAYVRGGRLGDCLKLVKVSTEFREDLVHKKKVIFVFQNTAMAEIRVGPASWSGNISLQHDFNPLRVRSFDGERWSKDQDAVVVGNGETFSVWINVLKSIEDSEILQRVALKNLGELTMTIKANGVTAEKRFLF